MPRFSRRSFLHLSAAASAAATFRTWTEPALAAAARRRHEPHPGATVIDSNENPLGPSQSARDAMASIIPQGGRYSDNLTDELVQTFAQMEGLNPEFVTATVGSTPPLALSVMAFCNAQKSYVTGDPGFELGMMTAESNGARVVKVPLTKTHAHDIKAMLAAAPDGGIFYICNPNNPTGTLTPRADIEYLLANKPNGSVVVVDEAYIHFTEAAPSALDLVKGAKTSSFCARSRRSTAWQAYAADFSLPVPTWVRGCCSVAASTSCPLRQWLPQRPACGIPH